MLLNKMYVSVNKFGSNPSYIHKVIGIILDCMGLKYANYEIGHSQVEQRVDDLNICTKEGVWWYQTWDETLCQEHNISEKVAESCFVSVLRAPEKDRFLQLVKIALEEPKIGEVLLVLIDLAERYNLTKTDFPNWGL